MDSIHDRYRKMKEIKYNLIKEIEHQNRDGLFLGYRTLK